MFVSFLISQLRLEDDLQPQGDASLLTSWDNHDRTREWVPSHIEDKCTDLKEKSRQIASTMTMTAAVGRLSLCDHFPRELPRWFVMRHAKAPKRFVLDDFVMSGTGSHVDSRSWEHPSARTTLSSSCSTCPLAAVSGCQTCIVSVSSNLQTL